MASRSPCSSYGTSYATVPSTPFARSHSNSFVHRPVPQRPTSPLSGARRGSYSSDRAGCRSPPHDRLAGRFPEAMARREAERRAASPRHGQRLPSNRPHSPAPRAAFPRTFSSPQGIAFAPRTPPSASTSFDQLALRSDDSPTRMRSSEDEGLGHLTWRERELLQYGAGRRENRAPKSSAGSTPPEAVDSRRKRRATSEAPPMARLPSSGATSTAVVEKCDITAEGQMSLSLGAWECEVGSAEWVRDVAASVGNGSSPVLESPRPIVPPREGRLERALSRAVSRSGSVSGRSRSGSLSRTKSESPDELVLPHDHFVTSRAASPASVYPTPPLNDGPLAPHTSPGSYFPADYTSADIERLRDTIPAAAVVKPKNPGKRSLSFLGGTSSTEEPARPVEMPPGSEGSGYISFASLNVHAPPSPPTTPPIVEEGKKGWWGR